MQLAIVSNSRSHANWLKAADPRRWPLIPVVPHDKWTLKKFSFPRAA
ncbi:hypothetical protein F4827_006025 [Paraburkholderia bannensis]|uniref:Uncharacterized protein n=1 Tax=Paraburkholderia bannensis TaxID=765414 RepID=A0A7W9WVW7_9BURK|nr:hypothetical protein [Paraburkholderia sp. WP4_3_2]MBB6106154.1 hypothetical protein [Paraburkholderia bannensis]